MAQVATLDELLTALANRETPIQLLNDITVDTLLTVAYPLVFESAGQTGKHPRALPIEKARPFFAKDRAFCFTI